MKPTHVSEAQNNAPAVIFRPTFHVTGTMLQTAILLMVIAGKLKITVDQVKTKIHEMLSTGGMMAFNHQSAQLMAIEADLDTAAPELKTYAEAVAHTNFPEFFNETKESADAKYAHILATKKDAKDDSKGNDTPKPKTSRKGKKNEAPDLPDSLQTQADLEDVFPNSLSDAAQSVLATKLDEIHANTEGNEPVFKKSATDEVSKAAAAPKKAAAKKTATPKKAVAPKTTTPAKKETLGDKLFGADRKIGKELRSAKDSPKKAAVQVKAAAPKKTAKKK